MPKNYYAHIQRIERRVRWIALCLCIAAVGWPRISAAISPVPDSARASADIEQFVIAVTQALPVLIQRDTLFHGVDTQAKSQAVLRLLGLGNRNTFGYALRADDLERLRNARELWNVADTDAQATWLLENYGLALTITPLFVRLSSEPRLWSSLDRCVDMMMLAAGNARNYETAQQLTASTNILRGALAVARHDTVEAMRAFLNAARVPRQGGVQWAAAQAVALAIARHDTTELVLALTLQRLQVIDSTRRNIDTQLRALYERYTAAHGTPPDAVPARLRADHLSSEVLSYDSYLDRQWTGLYQRTFTVVPAVLSPATPTDRLVVVEYGTDITCGGCWVDDAAFQPLTRRYPADRVLPLAYHDTPPVVGVGEQMTERFRIWYPWYWPDTTGKGTFRHQRRPTLPYAIVTTPTRDTLFASDFVDGHVLPYAKTETGHGWNHTSFFEESMARGEPMYRGAVTLVDQELMRPPLARLRLVPHVTDDRAIVTIYVDSVERTSHRLALRLQLFQDTVWLHSGTERRIYQNVVRAVAQNDTMPLGIPLAPDVATHPAILSYTFDLGAIEAGIRGGRDAQWIMTHDPDGDYADRAIAAHYAARYRKTFDDDRDWTLDRSRLHVVAFIQDLETGDILQAVQAKL